MTPKEKAKELVDKYFIIIDNSNPLEDILKTAKQCALIVVDEILDTLHQLSLEYEYWEEVEQEIENL